MQKLFQIIDNAEWTTIVLFGVCLMAIVAVTSINEKPKDRFINLSGRIVHNDYDPKGFRFLFTWCIFIAVIIGYFIYKYCTMPIMP